MDYLIDRLKNCIGENKMIQNEVENCNDISHMYGYFPGRNYKQIFNNNKCTIFKEENSKRIKVTFDDYPLPPC